MNQETKTIAPQEPTLFGWGWDAYTVPEFVASYASLARERHHCDESLTEDEQELVTRWSEFLANREWRTLGVRETPWGPQASIMVQA